MRNAKQTNDLKTFMVFHLFKKINAVKRQLMAYRTYSVKEIKNAPECIVELYKHAGIFKNTREVHREARGVAECFSHFSSVLKNSQVLI